MSGFKLVSRRRRGCGRAIRTFSGQPVLVYAVAATPDGRRIVSASFNNTLKVWNLESGRDLHTLSGHGNIVRAVALTPDGQRAVSASDDKTLKVWDMGTGHELRTLLGHTDGVWAVTLTWTGPGQSRLRLIGR